MSYVLNIIGTAFMEGCPSCQWKSAAEINDLNEKVRIVSSNGSFVFETVPASDGNIAFCQEGNV